MSDDLVGVHRVPASACPSCGAPNSGATSVEGGGPPVPGDIGVCFYCAEVLVYGPALETLRAAEDHPARRDPEVVHVREMVRRRFGMRTFRPKLP